MKHEKRISCLIAAVLAFCISFGCAAGIITGFSLNVTDGSVAVDFYTEPADLLTVMAFCAVFSVVAAIAFSFRWGGLVLMGILAFLLGYLWRIDVLEESVEAILYRLTYIYHQAYHCGIATWTDAYSPEVSPNLGLCIFAGIAVLVTAWTVCRRKSAIPAAIYSCALLGLCLVVTDTVPAAWCLFLLLVSLVLLILTNTVRRQNALDGNRLTALMLVPVLLFVSVLFWAVPSAGYESKVTDFQKLLAEWFQGQSSGDLIDSGFTGTALGAVNLSTVGPKIERYYPVMDVIAAEDGMLYLRGESLDAYDGKFWDASKASAGQDSGWPVQNTSVVGTVSISTRIGRPVKYFPYYSSGAHWPEDGVLNAGSIRNPHRQREYAFSQMKITGATGVQLSQELRQQCLELPDGTVSFAKRVLEQIGNMAGKTNQDIAQAVGKYVSESAQYDLNTDRMPSHADDFAVWFLQESDSGYCIHFASAAAVLLRAAGVPARYVSGYVVKAKAGVSVTVTENKAHAWVEYFVPERGWTVLDPTPASWYDDSDDIILPPSATDPSTEPTDPGTTPNSDPTEPGGRPTEPSQEPTPPNENNWHIKVDLSWLWPVLRWLGILFGICFAIGGQYLLRIRLRHRRMHTGHPNMRALTRWRAVVSMSRILKEEPPEELFELAEKAKFSQHTITVAERMEFDRYLNQADAALSQKPWLKRWLIRLLWAV